MTAPDAESDGVFEAKLRRRVEADLAKTSPDEPMDPLFACVRILHELAGMAQLLDPRTSRRDRAEGMLPYNRAILSAVIAGMRSVDLALGRQTDVDGTVTEVLRNVDHTHLPVGEAPLSAIDISHLVRSVGGIVDSVISGLAEEIRPALMTAACFSAALYLDVEHASSQEA